MEFERVVAHHHAGLRAEGGRMFGGSWLPGFFDQAFRPIAELSAPQPLEKLFGSAFATERDSFQVFLREIEAVRLLEPPSVFLGELSVGFLAVHGGEPFGPIGQIGVLGLL